MKVDRCIISRYILISCTVVKLYALPNCYAFLIEYLMLQSQVYKPFELVFFFSFSFLIYGSFLFIIIQFKAEITGFFYMQNLEYQVATVDSKNPGERSVN